MKKLCEDENYDEVTKLLLSNLSFEFAPGDIDNVSERFFAVTDHIEFVCASDNTSLKFVYYDCLIVTISVQFEIPLNGEISNVELAEYLRDSVAWSSASSP